MNRHPLITRDWAEVIDRLADYVHHATQRASADGNRDGAAEIDGVHTAHHAIGGLHGDAAHAAFAEVLLDFEDDVNRRGNSEAIAYDAKRLIDGRHFCLDELHVDGGAGDLDNVSDIFWHRTSAASY